MTPAFHYYAPETRAAIRKVLCLLTVCVMCCVCSRWMSGEANQSIQDTFGSFANQGYVYGREWLAGQVRPTHVHVGVIDYRCTLHVHFV